MAAKKLDILQTITHGWGKGETARRVHFPAGAKVEVGDEPNQVPQDVAEMFRMKGIAAYEANIETPADGPASPAAAPRRPPMAGGNLASKVR